MIHHLLSHIEQAEIGTLRAGILAEHHAGDLAGAGTVPLVLLQSMEGDVGHDPWAAERVVDGVDLACHQVPCFLDHSAEIIKAELKVVECPQTTGKVLLVHITKPGLGIPHYGHLSRHHDAKSRVVVDDVVGGLHQHGADLDDNPGGGAGVQGL